MLMNFIDTEIFENILQRITLKKYYLRISLPNTKYLNFLHQLEDFHKIIEGVSEDICLEVNLHAIRSKFKSFEKAYIKISKELQNEYNIIENNFSESLLTDFINEIQKSTETFESCINAFLVDIKLCLKDLCDINLIFHIEDNLQEILSEITVIRKNFKNWEHIIKFQKNGDTLKYFYSLLIKYLNAEYFDIEHLFYNTNKSFTDNMSEQTISTVDDAESTDNLSKSFGSLQGICSSSNRLKDVSNPKTNSSLNQAAAELKILNEVMDRINQEISDKRRRFKHDIYNIEQERDITLKTKSLEQDKKNAALDTFNEMAKNLKNQHEGLIKNLELKRNEILQITELHVQKMEDIIQRLTQENIGDVNKSSQFEYGISSTDVLQSDEDGILLKNHLNPMKRENSLVGDVLENSCLSTIPGQSNIHSENENSQYKDLNILRKDASSKGSGTQRLEKKKKVEAVDTSNVTGTKLKNQHEDKNLELQSEVRKKTVQRTDIIKESVRQENVSDPNKSTEFEHGISSFDKLKSDKTSSLSDNDEHVAPNNSHLNKSATEIARLEEILKHINKDISDKTLGFNHDINNIEKERDLVLEDKSLEQDKKMETVETLNEAAKTLKYQHEGLIKCHELKRSQVRKIKEYLTQGNYGELCKSTEFEHGISSFDMLKSDEDSSLSENDENAALTDNLNKQIKDVPKPLYKSHLNKSAAEIARMDEILERINTDISNKTLAFKHDIYNIEKGRDLVLEDKSLEQDKKVETVETLNEAAKTLKYQQEGLIKCHELKRTQVRKIKEYLTQGNYGELCKSTKFEHGTLSFDMLQSDEDSSLSENDDNAALTDNLNKQLRDVPKPLYKSHLNKSATEIARLDKILERINKDISDKTLAFNQDIYNIEKERDLVLEDKSLEQDKKIETVETLNEAAKTLKYQHEGLIKCHELKRSQVCKIKEYLTQGNYGECKSTEFKHEVPKSDEDGFVLNNDLNQMEKGLSSIQEFLEFSLDTDKSQSTFPEKSNSDGILKELENMKHRGSTQNTRSEDTGNLDDEDYIKKYLGKDLVKAIANVALYQPRDPINYIANFLLNKNPK